MHWLKRTNLTNHQIIIPLTLFWIISLFFLTQLIICRESSQVCFNLTTLSNWDGQHFLQIADRGYLYPYQLAFFPLFPLLIRLMGAFMPLPLYLIAIVLNICFTVAAFSYLFRFLKEQYSAQISLQIIGLIICFPLSFFFFTVYSESLFFCLSVMAVFYYIKKRYWLTIFLLSLLVLTRMAGLALIGAIIIDLYLKKESFKRFLIPIFCRVFFL